MKHLYFKEDTPFKILQFTDIHYCEDNETDHGSIILMTKLIQEEKPDFIIVTGDTVYGRNNAKFLEKALAPIINGGIPWSYTFGNHDTEDGADYVTLYSILTNLPNCYLYHAEDSKKGMGNHYLELKNQKGDTKWVLFGLDTGSGNKIPQVGGYDYLKTEQIKWYMKSIESLKERNNTFSSLVFMHIAIPEYNEVWDMEICYGEKREAVCCPRINTGFFAAMEEAGHTKGVFVGHDHINDYMGELYGITLGYGRATGYNTYGQEGYLRGARVFILEENNIDNFKTYIRLEDGTVITNQKEHKPERKREEE